MANSAKIKMMTWNCCTIKDKLLELKEHIYQNDIDVIGLNETRLNPDHKLKIRGYKVYRNDRNSCGGGVAILIKNKIKHSQLHTPTLDTLEAISIQIETTVGNITTTAVYNPPNKLITENDLNAIFKNHNKTIVFGDLNAKSIIWNCPIINRNGRTITNYANKHNIQIAAPTDPTHYPTRGRPSVLDIVLLKNIKEISIPESHQALSSDHNPVEFIISKDIEFKSPRTILNFKNANWSDFKKELDLNIPTPNPIIENSHDIDHQIQILLQAIEKAIDKHVPTTKIADTTEELPESIKFWIKIKNRTRRKHQKTRLRSDKRKLTNLETIVQQKLSDWSNKSWNTVLNNLKPATNNLWKITKHL